MAGERTAVPHLGCVIIAVHGVHNIWRVWYTGLALPLRVVRGGALPDTLSTHPNPNPNHTRLREKRNERKKPTKHLKR